MIFHKILFSHEMNSISGKPFLRRMTHRTVEEVLHMGRSQRLLLSLWKTISGLMADKPFSPNVCKVMLPRSSASFAYRPSKNCFVAVSGRPSIGMLTRTGSRKLIKHLITVKLFIAFANDPYRCSLFLFNLTSFCLFVTATDHPVSEKCSTFGEEARGKKSQMSSSKIVTRRRSSEASDHEKLNIIHICLLSMNTTFVASENFPS